MNRPLNRISKSHRSAVLAFASTAILGFVVIAWPRLSIVVTAGISLVVAVRAASQELRRTIRADELQMIRVQESRADAYRTETFNI